MILGRGGAGTQVETRRAVMQVCERIHKAIMTDGRCQMMDDSRRELTVDRGACQQEDGGINVGRR